MDEAYPLLAVAGPTGSGKSHLSLRLAMELDGEIVNFDSLQLYRYFNIGTAKTPEPERGAIPHHLVDIADPGQEFTAGEFARRARQALAGIRGRGRLPILAGGTGFYLRALLEGLFPGPGRDAALRDRLAARERRRTGSLHRLLRRLDPAAAVRIHAHDLPKVIRALEVRLLARRPITRLFAEGRDALTGYRVLKIGLAPDRGALYARLDRRCEGMFASGLLEEVRAILARGYSPQAKPFQSIGYKQALQLLAGESDLARALDSAQRATRRYAKRQMTWFRREADIHWVHGFGDEEHVQQAVLERARKFLRDFFPPRS